MVKEKNHTNRNQSYKAHRRGIKKVKPQRYRSLRGVSVTRGAKREKRESVRGRARSADSALHALQGMEGVSFSGSATVWGTGAERRHCFDRKQQQHGMAATSLRPHPRARVSTEKKSASAPGGCRRLTCLRGIGPRMRTGKQHGVVRWPSQFGLLELLWSWYLLVPPGTSSRATSARVRTKARSRGAKPRREPPGVVSALASLRCGPLCRRWPPGCQMRSRQRVARAIWGILDAPFPSPAHPLSAVAALDL
jgi:large subunit ribosomal protein L29e